MFFFKQKTAYEMRISDWSSDVCSSDLRIRLDVAVIILAGPDELARPFQRRCDHVVDEAVFIDDVRLLELVGEFGVEHLLEQVLEAPAIGLPDRVLGGKIDRPAAIEAVVEPGAGEIPDRIVEIEQAHGDAAQIRTADV